MALVSSSRLRPLVISPCCGEQVEWFADESAKCLACSTRFDVVAGQPVLVDFRASILVRSEVLAGDAASPLVRPSRSGVLRRSVRRSNPVAERAVERIVEEVGPTGLCLVVGGGSIGNGADLLYGSSVGVIGFDIYASDATQFVADGHNIPLADASVDGVVVQAVLEHVLEPSTVVHEIHRVLRPGGLVYAETPFMQQVHESAYDFTRFTERGHRWLFRSFEEIETGVVAGPGLALAWSIDYFVRALLRSRRAGLMARKIVGVLRVADRLIDDEYATPGASVVFFFGRRSDRAISPAELIAGYTGREA